MRALKILVVAMGIILVVGFIVLIAVIAQRISHRVASPPSLLASAPVSTHRGPMSNPGAMSDFTPKDLPIPTGAKLLSATPSGDQILLRLALKDGNEELLLVDWQGQRIAALHLRPEAAEFSPKP